MLDLQVSLSSNAPGSLSTLPVAYNGANWNRTQQKIDVLAKFQMGVAQRGARAAAAANASTRIDATARFGRWEGWGTSLCWWANVFGASEHAANIADAFFTMKETTTVGGHAVPGLGLTIARYNAGGSSSRPDHLGEKEARSPNIRAGGEVMGFWLDWSSDDPASSSWDWSVDAAQRAMLTLARERAGAAFIAELFSNRLR